MNILHLDSGREMRGGQWQALLLMQALARRGHPQELLARPGSPLLERARRAGLAAGPLRAGLRLPADVIQPDVIHAHDAGAHTWAALRSLFGRSAPRRRGPAPLVVSRRVAFPIGRGWFSRWKYSRAARYIAVSRYVARELAFAGVAEKRIAVVFDGVRLPDLSAAAEQRAEFRRRWNLAPDAFVAGTLTTLREKPILPLLEAAEGRARLHLLVASGDASERPAQRGPANIHFLRPEEDISPFLFALDVFVHLSEAEGLGSAALLAMAHGLPVVASDVGGLPEIVRDGETGLLVRNLALEVGRALEKLFADRAQATEIGRRARRFVEATATDDIMAQRTEEVYRDAIENTVGSRD